MFCPPLDNEDNPGGKNTDTPTPPVPNGRTGLPSGVACTTKL